MSILVSIDLSVCEVYYHARSMKDSPFLEHEMLKTPISVSNSHGRYNDIGISCYYFTDQKDGAINEVRKHIGRGNSAIHEEKIIHI